MKNLFLLILSFIFFNSAVYAETIIVQSMSDISTFNPPKTATIKVLSDIQLDEQLTLNCGDIIMGYITDVIDPKVLKRSAKFSFKIFGILKGNKIVYIENDYIGKYTTKIDKAAIAKSAALGVGNFFVKGLSIGYHAVEGAIKNEEGNTLESSAVAVYKNSPFSYVEKGENITIKNGDIFYLKFKTYKETDEEKDED